MSSCSLEDSAISDSKDIGAAEYFDHVWATCSVNVADDSSENITAVAAKVVAASIDSTVVNSDKGPCSVQDFSGDLTMNPVIVCFLFF